MRSWYFLLIIAIGLIAGCSGGNGGIPTFPGDSQIQAVPGSPSHHLWGMWQIIADPDAGELVIIPLRSTTFHANVVPFLEPPAGVRLSVSNIMFDENICDVDVSLTHPFPGLSEYTGFDVCGTFISSGTWMGFNDPDLVAAGPGDTRVVNPDGLIRWWNPVEFPEDGTILRYKDGLLGNPDADAHYNCTLNGYKLFGDDIGSEDDILDLDPSNRVVFSSGFTNTRHYTIDFSAELLFNYAVDANWEPPSGSDPYTIENFPPEANRAEAWAISVTELENTLWNDGSGSSGGNLSLSIDVRDHYNADQNTLWVESPGNFDPTYAISTGGGGEGFSTYQVDIIDATPDAGSFDLLVGVESEVLGYWDLFPGEPLTGYFIYRTQVVEEDLILVSPNGGEGWDVGTEYEITWVTQGSVSFVDLEYSKDDFVSDIIEITSDYANTGSYLWIVPPDPSETVKVRVTESGGGLTDESDGYFSILEQSCDFGTTGFTLDTLYTWVSGTYPWRGILVTQQDSTQRVVFRDNNNSNTSILIFNADNIAGGSVASYATGDLIYCNNDHAMWMDGYSEPGVDRIAYNNYYNYQLKLIDWDGSNFVNPQVLGKVAGRPTYHLCFKDNGDIITYNGNGYFYLWDKSEGYTYSVLFVLTTGEVPAFGLGVLEDIVYDPVLDAVLLFTDNQSVSYGGQLYAVNMNGQNIFEDTEVFPVDSGNNLGFHLGIDIDLNYPDCRVVLFGSENPGVFGSALKFWFARYSGDLVEKATNNISPAPYEYGPCRGDLTPDGTLWAAPGSGYQHLYKFTPPPDW